MCVCVGISTVCAELRHFVVREPGSRDTAVHLNKAKVREPDQTVFVGALRESYCSVTRLQRFGWLTRVPFSLALCTSKPHKLPSS